MKHIPYIAPTGVGKGRYPGCTCGWSPMGNWSKALAQELAIRHAYYANKTEEVTRGDLEENS